MTNRYSPDKDAHGMLCRIRNDGMSGASRPGELKIVDAVFDRDGGIEYYDMRWVDKSSGEFWTIVDSKFAGSVYWYKVVSNLGASGWTDQGWKLEPAGTQDGR
jgi:hypothetical protein